MSTLSKVFVVLLLVMSLVYLGVSATLFSQRVDWVKKYDLERMRHADSIKQRDLVIAHKQAELDQLKRNEASLSEAIRQLNVEKKDLMDRLSSTQLVLDDLRTQMAAQTLRLAEVVDQLKAVTHQADEYRQKMELATADAATARAERDQALYLQQQASRDLELRNKDMAELERISVELAKEKDKNEVVLQRLAAQGIPVTAIAAHDLPKNLNGKVMGVSEAFNVAVVSVGADDGVKIGFPFTIYRGDKFVAKAVVEKVDKDFCTVHWDPGFARDKVMVGDDVTTSVTFGPSGESKEKKGK